MRQFILAILLMGFVFSLANPSAVYCEELGYEYKTIEGPDGEEGVCKLPSGQEVNAWSFFRGEVGVQYSYCMKEGYGMRTVTEESDGATYVYGACILSNGTAVPVSELMGLETGETAPEEEGAEEEAPPEEPAEEGEEAPPEETAPEEPAEEEPAEPAEEEEPAEPEETAPEEPAEEEPAEPEETAGEEEPAPAAEFPLIPVLVVVIVIAVVAYWFSTKK
ncbi:DUF333 domain-containing protein [Candidatus Micrarchaeota archaeon]|nr:DUF333 domain-containing protein [Candidatus Micrarchaeota archaeon]MBD3417375.1 DUF333 domain-containing protein [Candidatus Micrarchaeota archaeon]